MKDLDFKIGTTNLSYDCHVSDFRYEPAGYVVTRNLGIIGNRKLRKLLSKGPSYREQNNINWDMNQKSSRKQLGHTKYSGQKRKK